MIKGEKENRNESISVLFLKDIVVQGDILSFRAELLKYEKGTCIVVIKGKEDRNEREFKENDRKISY